MRGVAKHLLEAARTDPTAIDRQFIDGYASGFEAYRALVEAVSWDELERQSGVPQAQIRALGEVCRQSQFLVLLLDKGLRLLLNRYRQGLLSKRGFEPQEMTVIGDGKWRWPPCWPLTWSSGRWTIQATLFASPLMAFSAQRSKIG
jgi:hypothetical protein